MPFPDASFLFLLATSLKEKENPSLLPSRGISFLLRGMLSVKENYGPSLLPEKEKTSLPCPVGEEGSNLRFDFCKRKEG